MVHGYHQSAEATKINLCHSVILIKDGFQWQNNSALFCKIEYVSILAIAKRANMNSIYSCMYEISMRTDTDHSHTCK
jgi:hypothetical protein